MMEQVTSGSKKGTKQLLRMLPGLRSEDESSQDFRLLLHQYTKQLKAVSETPLRYSYHLPAADVRRAAAAVPSSLRTCPTARPAR